MPLNTLLKVTYLIIHYFEYMHCEYNSAFFCTVILTVQYMTQVIWFSHPLYTDQRCCSYLNSCIAVVVARRGNPRLPICATVVHWQDKESRGMERLGKRAHFST